jgi:hypothetical protein
MANHAAFLPPYDQAIPKACGFEAATQEPATHAILVLLRQQGKCLRNNHTLASERSGGSLKVKDLGDGFPPNRSYSSGGSLKVEDLGDGFPPNRSYSSGGSLKVKDLGDGFPPNRSYSSGGSLKVEDLGDGSLPNRSYSESSTGSASSVSGRAAGSTACTTPALTTKLSSQASPGSRAMPSEPPERMT